MSFFFTNMYNTKYSIQYQNWAYYIGRSIFTYFFFSQIVLTLELCVCLPLSWPVGEKWKWMWKGLRKRDIFPPLHWGSELSTELLVCVKRYIDVIEIDTAVRLEEREQLSILHHRTSTSTHTKRNEKFTVQTRCQKLGRKIQNNLLFFFFWLLKKSKSNCQLSEDYSTMVGSLTSPS